MCGKGGSELFAMSGMHRVYEERTTQQDRASKRTCQRTLWGRSRWICEPSGLVGDASQNVCVWYLVGV